jgi:site-specific DNA-methyltransferase (adenine-specific)
MNETIKSIKEKNLYYNKEKFILFKGDSIELMEKIKENSIDMIFADPPYFLSNDGITCKSGEMVSVNKGEWDKKDNIEEIHKFNQAWLKEAKRILTQDGTIWVSGTYHNIYSLGMALQENNYKILNNIVWFKKNPPPNLGCRTFTHSNETIIWAKKSKDSKHYFNYALMKSINNNKQMKDVWRIGSLRKDEKKHGKHPTQKPINLLKRIVQASTERNMVVLDPFNGSGTTGLAAAELGRKYIGIELEEEYLDLTVKRYEEFSRQLKLF